MGADAQIRWGLEYIKRNYGTQQDICRAFAVPSRVIGLPWSLRSQLRLVKSIDRAAIWLTDHGHDRVAIWLWRVFRLW